MSLIAIVVQNEIKDNHADVTACCLAVTTGHASTQVSIIVRQY